MIDEEKQMFFGSLLGDGFLNRSERGNYSFRCEHSIKQKEYLDWKNSFIKSYRFRTDQRDRESFFKKENRIIKSTSYRVLTQNHEDFTKIYPLFYMNKIKYLNREVLKELKPLGLAIWYLDDGCYHLNRFTGIIATDCFSLENLKDVKTFFLDEYDINVSIVKQGKGKKKHYRIYFPKNEMIKFLSIINNVVPKNILSYKIPTYWDKVRDITFGFHKRLNNSLPVEEKKTLISENLKNFWVLENSPEGFPWVKYVMSENTFSHTLIDTYFGSRENALQSSNVPTNII